MESRKDVKLYGFNLYDYTSVELFFDIIQIVDPSVTLCEVTDDRVMMLLNLFLENRFDYARDMMSVAFTGRDIFSGRVTNNVNTVVNRSLTLKEGCTVTIVDAHHRLHALLQFAVEKKVDWAFNRLGFVTPDGEMAE